VPTALTKSEVRQPTRLEKKNIRSPLWKKAGLEQAPRPAVQGKQDRPILPRKNGRLSFLVPTLIRGGLNRCQPPEVRRLSS
jgi:hypothetical protein